MKFRHKIETVNINGIREFSVNYFLCDELIVGRGSACLIRLASRLVALSHARVTLVENALLIEDLKTDSGTRVNDVLTKRQMLKAGDRVKVGDVTFTVFFDGTYWGFHEVREEQPQEDREATVKKNLRALDLHRFYPSFLSFSLLIVATVALVAFVEPYVGMNVHLWSSGPVSNAHRMLENNCKACHAKPFSPVRDKDCLACHNMSEHAPTLKTAAAAHPLLDFRCEDCHHEHNGTEGMKEKSPALCVQCHGKLGELAPGTRHPIVDSFRRHPEFAVSIPQYGPDDLQAAVKRVTLSDENDLFDTTRLKLNHKIHLAKDLRSPNGPRTLQCMDCHKLTEDLKNVAPITFESQCRSCHTVGFDERLPDKQVPHGEPDTVFNFIYAEYAKLFLDTEKAGARQDFVRRFRPGQTEQSETPDIDFTKRFVEQESRTAEQQLFTKTGCFLCHQVKASENPGPGKSDFRVLVPNVPTRWMPETIFEHGAHQELSCESCHAGARSSVATGDVLLPKIAECRVCHEQGVKRGKVNSPCSMCHSFHQPLLLTEENKRISKLITLSGMQ